MLKRNLLTALLLWAVIQCHALAGSVGLPVETIHFPSVISSGQIRIYDYAASNWIKLQNISNIGEYVIEVPAWNKWYWVGVWNNATQSYAYGVYVGHHKTN